MKTIVNVILCFGLAFCVIVACYYWCRYVVDCSRKHPDRSLWMYCSNCIVKWRPTAYGPPAPDDYFCPECGRDGGVRMIQDIRQVIRKE